MKNDKLYEEVAIVFRSGHPLNLGNEQLLYLTNKDHELNGSDYGVIVVPRKNPAAPFLVPWWKIDHLPMAPVKKVEPRTPIAKKARARRKK